MDRLLHNAWAVRVLSVLIAVLVWFVATTQQNPLVTAEVAAVPVNLEGLAASCAVLQAQPAAVTLEVRSRRNAVGRLDRKQFVASASLAGLGPGTARAWVAVSGPPGVQVLEVKPPEVEVRLDRLGSRQVPVTVALDGQPAEGYRVEAARPRPSQVLLEGPEEYLRRAVQAQARVRVAGLSTAAEATVPLVPVDFREGKVEGLRASPATVEVALEVSQLPPAKVLPVRVRLEGHPSPGHLLAGIKTEPAGVEVRGPADVLEGLVLLEVGPVVVSGASRDVVQELEVPLPEGAEGVEPGVVKVTVLVEPEVTRTLERVPVVLEGLALRTVGQVSPTEVTVVVKGASSLVTSLDPAQVTVGVDALGLEPGDYRVTPGVSLPSGLRGSVEPATVTLRVVGPGS